MRRAVGPFFNLPSAAAAAVTTTITLVPASIAINAGTLSIKRVKRISLGAASIAITGGTLGISVRQVITLDPANIAINGGTLGIHQNSNITMLPATIAFNGGTLGIITSTVPVVPKTGAGSTRKRRRRRQFVNIDGNLVEVASYKEALKLFQHLNKTKEPLKKRRIRLKVAGNPYVTIFDDPSELLPVRRVHKILDKSFEEEEEIMLLLLLAA